MLLLILTYLCPLVLTSSSPILGSSIPPYYKPGQSTLGFASILGLAALLPAGLAAGPRYVPKWKKQACEIPAAQHPNSHYVCDEAGEVKCTPGWIGDLCDVPLCRKGCDPLQGYCRRPGECRCKLGFYGELCEKCVPLPGCQHGGCNVSFECACDPGWKGIFCSEPLCDSDCHPSQGYCDKPGECRCRLGWKGEKCKECAVLPGCVHGTCKGPLECRCNPGWTGFLCQIPICAQGCSREHGICNRPGTCRCKVGWTGPNCTECVAYPGCVHGSCRRPWDCRCEPGWGGDLCEEKLTFCDHHSNLCKNNATCVSMTKENGDYRCICPLGYMGRQCQIQTMVPATDLTPPLPESSFAVLTPDSTSTTTTTTTTTTTIKSIILDETTENHEATKPQKPADFLNAHQGHEITITTGQTDRQDDTTIEPLETIYVTDSSTIDPSATAGKWPTEPPTESPVTDNDADNEA